MSPREYAERSRQPTPEQARELAAAWANYTEAEQIAALREMAGIPLTETSLRVMLQRLQQEM